MSYRLQLQLASRIRTERPNPARKPSANLYDIYLLLCVLWKTPDDRQRNCTKYLEFYSKNKCEKLVRLFGFSVRIKRTKLEFFFKFLGNLKTLNVAPNLCCPRWNLPYVLCDSHKYLVIILTSTIGEDLPIFVLNYFVRHSIMWRGIC